MASIAELEAQAATRPKDASLRVEIGLLREQAGDLFGACAEYKEALRIKPSYARARRCLDIARGATGPTTSAEARGDRLTAKPDPPIVVAGPDAEESTRSRAQGLPEDRRRRHQDRPNPPAADRAATGVVEGDDGRNGRRGGDAGGATTGPTAPTTTTVVPSDRTDDRRSSEEEEEEEPLAAAAAALRERDRARLLRDEIEAHPRDVALRVELGQLLLHLGDADGARARARAAIDKASALSTVTSSEWCEGVPPTPDAPHHCRPL